MQGTTTRIALAISRTSAKEPSIAALPLISGRRVTGLPAWRSSSKNRLQARQDYFEHFGCRRPK